MLFDYYDPHNKRDRMQFFAAPNQTAMGPENPTPDFVNQNRVVFADRATLKRPMEYDRSTLDLVASFASLSK